MPFYLASEANPTARAGNGDPRWPIPCQFPAVPGIPRPPVGAVIAAHLRQHEQLLRLALAELVDGERTYAAGHPLRAAAQTLAELGIADGSLSIAGDISIRLSPAHVGEARAIGEWQSGRSLAEQPNE